MLRFIRLAVEFIAAFAGVVVLIGAILIWRLSEKPISSEVLTPYIAAALQFTLPDTDVAIAHTQMSWDNVDYAIGLHADGIVVKNKDGEAIGEIPTLDMRLNAFGVLIGQALPRTLIMTHPQFRLDRGADGQLYFGGLSTQPKTRGDHDVHQVMRGIAHRLAHAYFLRKLDISDVDIDVYDAQGQKQWSVHMPSIALERVKGMLAGHVEIGLTQKAGMSTLDLAYSYSSAKGLHQLTTKLDNITPAQLAGGHPELVGLAPAAMLNMPLSGAIVVAVDNNLAVHHASLDMHGGAGTLNAPNLWDMPRRVQSLDVKAGFDDGKLDVSSAKVDFGGPALSATVSGKEPEFGSEDLDFKLAVKLANWPMDQFTRLWPKPIIADARDWMAANMTKGMYDNGEATFKGNLKWNDLGNINFTEGQGTIKASHAQVAYMDGMPPVEDVSADATFDLNQMTIQITGGGIGNLRLTPFAIAITGFENDTQDIDIPLALTGPIPDVLALIDQPPLRYARDAGLKPDDVTGAADGTVDLKFPLVKTLAMKDVDIHATAKLNNLASSKLVKGIDITQGAFIFTLDKAHYDLKGAATFNNIPLQLSWQQNFHPDAGKPLRQATLRGTIADDQWKKLDADTFGGTRGPVAVVLQINQNEAGETRLSGNADLTPAEFHLNQLNWKKPAGASATFALAGELPPGGGIKITSLTLSGAKVDVKGKAVLDADNDITSLSFSPMIVGRTNATLDVTRTKDTLQFAAQGVALDVSGLRGGKEPDHSTPQPKEFRIKVGKLFTSDDGYISAAEGYAIRDAQGWSAIDLNGYADGSHKLAIELTPKDNIRTFSITCDDFGAALKGMGFTDTVKGGALKIAGNSTPDAPRVITGTVKVESFDVKDLPVLVQLINATSPFGFAGLLTNSATFDHLKGHFRWEDDSVDLTKVNVTGTTGININGKVDMNSGVAKLDGTLVPFNMVNRILGAIPLLGDVITGGNNGGVLAVAYSIDGPLANPKVSVNPVSLLTPGFLRNLFFGGDEEEADEGKKNGAALQPVPVPVPTPTPAAPAAAPANVNINK